MNGPGEQGQQRLEHVHLERAGGYPQTPHDRLQNLLKPLHSRRVALVALGLLHAGLELALRHVHHSEELGRRWAARFGLKHLVPHHRAAPPITRPHTAKCLSRVNITRAGASSAPALQRFQSWSEKLRSLRPTAKSTLHLFRRQVEGLPDACYSRSRCPVR